jgi:hypothetical protein
MNTAKILAFLRSPPGEPPTGKPPDSEPTKKPAPAANEEPAETNEQRAETTCSTENPQGGLTQKPLPPTAELTDEALDEYKMQKDEEEGRRLAAAAEYLGAEPPATNTSSGEESEVMKLWKCSDFELIEKPEGLDLLGQGIIRQGQMTLLIGQGGLGKSTLAFALPVAGVRREKHFAGIPLHKSPFTCLIFNAEASQWRWKDDFLAAKAGTRQDLHGDFDSHIHIAPLFDQKSGDFEQGSFAIQIKRAVAKVMPDLVVFDPWSEFAIDEIDSKTVRNSIRQLKVAVWSANPKAAILVVIHGKPGMEAAAAGASNFGGGSNQRGNRAVYNSARAALSIAPFGDQGTDIVLSLSKANDAPPLAPRRLSLDRQKLTYLVDPDFDPGSWRNDLRKNKPTAKVSEDDVIKAIEAAEIGMRTPKDIVDKLRKLPSGPSERTINRAIADAKASGKVVKYGRQLGVVSTRSSDSE